MRCLNNRSEDISDLFESEFADMSGGEVFDEEVPGWGQTMDDSGKFVHGLV